MATLYNPSFVHPNFVQADYGTEFGAGVNFNPNQLTFNLSTPNRVRAFKGRIFNSQAYCKCSWDSFGNTHWGGSSPIVFGFYNVRSGWPTQDFFWWQVVIAAQTGGNSIWKFTAMTSQTGIVGELPYFALPDDNTGDIELWVEVGPDNGSGQCNVQWRAINTKYGVNLTYNATNYSPLTNIKEWFEEFYGMPSDWGRVILSENILQASSYFLPSSIISGELFGSPTIVAIAPLIISPTGIVSSEAFGIPVVNVSSTQFIIVDGISTGEAFGIPSIIKLNKIVSDLPLDYISEEGDILFTLDQYDGYADVSLADRDVERDGGLETAILITLGTDKRVGDEEPLPDDGGYKGGWFGDNISYIPDDKIGWKGWLLRRSKTVNEVIAKCQEYLEDGFQWMLDDGIISDFQYTVTRESINNRSTVLKMGLKFVRPGGQNIFYTFYYNWEKQLIKRG